jgi:hypothetical protein
MWKRCVDQMNWKKWNKNWSFEEKAKVQINIFYRFIFNVAQNRATTSRMFVYTCEDGMVEKWRAITFEYFGNEWFNGGLGNNSSLAKKWIILYLGRDQSLWQVMEC